MNDYAVALFHTTAAAMRAESVLAGVGMQVRLIPTPRHLSSDCGIALRFSWDEADEVRAKLQAARLESTGLHRLG